MPGENVDPRYRKALAEDRASGAYAPHTRTPAGDPKLYPAPKKAGKLSPPNERVNKVGGVVRVEQMHGTQFNLEKENRAQVLRQGFFRRPIPRSETVTPTPRVRRGE